MSNNDYTSMSSKDIAKSSDHYDESFKYRFTSGPFPAASSAAPIFNEIEQGIRNYQRDMNHIAQSICAPSQIFSQPMQKNAAKPISKGSELDMFGTFYQRFIGTQHDLNSQNQSKFMENEIPGLTSLMKLVTCAARAYMTEQKLIRSVAENNESNFQEHDQNFSKTSRYNSENEVLLPEGNTGKRKRDYFSDNFMNFDPLGFDLQSILSTAHLTNTNKVSLVDRALFTQIESTTGSLGLAFSTYINSEGGKAIMEEETGHSHSQWLTSLVLNDAIPFSVPLISLTMLESTVDGVKLQEVLSKRWGYLAKTARDIIKDFQTKQKHKPWVQCYMEVYDEFSQQAMQLVESGAASNLDIEDTDPYFERDVSNRNDPEAMTSAKVMRRIISGAFYSRKKLVSNENVIENIGLDQSFQYILASSNFFLNKMRNGSVSSLEHGGGPRAELLKKLWIVLGSGFFQKAKLKFTSLNPIGNAYIYLALDAAIRGCNMTERSHLTLHVQILSMLHEHTLIAELPKTSHTSTIQASTPSITLV